jgi:hypothetical protein
VQAGLAAAVGALRACDTFAILRLLRATLAESQQLQRHCVDSARRRSLLFLVPTAEDARAFLNVGASPVDPALEPREFAAWMLLASQLFNTDYALNK